ncbi:c-type cytochrome [Lignipirellula cremea]|uniref:Cytochrome c n=1 Tax=Lignipirellula cremea TaxID=2528010 RepID=A0A518E3T3_9BACT|nr:c-type cytochrome [Lignipirellula cremea]QDU98732.1 Cytochrome c [Lignipirellula cremea]
MLRSCGGWAALGWLLAVPLLTLSAAEPDPAQAARDSTIVQTLMRLSGFDLESRPDLKQAVARHLETVRGEDRYLEIVEKLQFRAAADDLLQLALTKPNDTQGVKAAALLFSLGEQKRLETALTDEQPQAVAAAQVLGNVGDAACVELLLPLLTAAETPAPVRVATAQALGGNRRGEQVLLEMAKEDRLPTELRFVAADLLLSSVDPATREEAGKHLQRPATADAQPLPPLSELVAARGDAGRGREIYLNKGTCAKCHVVGDQGKEVGPNLSEIGSKLSREAMYVSILDPSAGISHNYETHALITESGKVIAGIIISETDDAISIKSADAIVRTIPRAEIDEMVKQKQSLMPADLQKNLTRQDLIDVVEFLGTLRKKE